MKRLALVAAAAAALLTGGRAAAGTSDLTLVSPTTPVVQTQAVTIVLHSDTIQQKVRLEATDLGESHPARLSAPDANGDFHFTEAVGRNGGTYHFEAYLGGDRGTPLLTFALGFQPRLTALQSPGSGTTLMAPGCRVCLVRDPRGDTHGGPPDLESFSAKVAGGWVSIRVATYGAARFNGTQNPCVEGWALGQGRSRSLGMGCFTGPHTGKIYGGCLHPDRDGNCGSAHMAFPNGHTVTFRFRASQLNTPFQLALQAWILYPGDRLMDTIPNVVHLGNAPTTNCFVLVQVRRGTPNDFQFGRSLCSQAGVVTAKP